MRLFLKRILQFSSMILVYCLMNFGLNKYLIKSNPIELEEPNVIIMGDSYLWRSLDPSFWESAKNVSKPAEPYVASYWKYKEILKYETPDTLILGLSPHNISTFNDLKFSHPKWENEMFKRYYSIENFNSVDKRIKIDYLKFYKSTFQIMCLLPKFNHNEFIGRYKPLNFSKIDDGKDAIEGHFYTFGESQYISNFQLDYLDSILKLSKEYNVEVVLVSTPLHINYFEKIPDHILVFYDELKNELKEEWIVIEGEQIPLPSDYFLNVNHVNEKGAKVFSRFVKEKLNKAS